MRALLRNNAAAKTYGGIDGADLGHGQGDGRGIAAFTRKKVNPKVRYSHDPAGDLMPSAAFLGHAPDFGAILEEFSDSPFDPSRRQVLGKLMGVFAMDYQSARSQERAFLRRLLMARNAKEGYAANRALFLCGASNALRRTLALGVAESRWAIGPCAGFLGAVQARIAATTFMLLGPMGRERIWNVLTIAGRHDTGKLLPASDPVIERALILKAIGARRHRLGPWSKSGDTALDEVESFAAGIRGMRRAQLSETTTVSASIRKKESAALNNMDAAERAAVIARGDIDPVFALSMHHQKTNTPSAAKTDEGVADIYESLPALESNLLLDRPRLHQALAEARAHQGTLLSLPVVAAVADHITGRELPSTRQTDVDEGIQVLQTQCFDAVRTKAIEAIRADSQGIYKFDAAWGLGLLLSRYTGAMYVRRVLSDQLTAGADPIVQIGRCLENGMSVPFLVKRARSELLRAWAVVRQHEQHGKTLFDVCEPDTQCDIQLPTTIWLSRELPKTFGKHTRVDYYLAPASLDLLAAPFGIVFPNIGITDVL